MQFRRTHDLRDPKTGKRQPVPEGVEVYRSARYTVWKRLVNFDGLEMWWLSIKRNDREPLRSWSDLQQIKNLLVGPEHEGVEVFPAESRLVDGANQYHLWVLAKPGARFRYGFNEGRQIGTPEEAEAVGAKQSTQGVGQG